MIENRSFRYLLQKLSCANLTSKDGENATRANRIRHATMATKKTLTSLAPAFRQTFSMQARNSTVRIECSDPNLLLSVMQSHSTSTSPPSAARTSAAPVARHSSLSAHDQGSGARMREAFAANAAWQSKLREAQRIDQASGETLCLDACEIAAAFTCAGGFPRLRAQT